MQNKSIKRDSVKLNVNKSPIIKSECQYSAVHVAPIEHKVQ